MNDQINAPSSSASDVATVQEWIKRTRLSYKSHGPADAMERILASAPAPSSLAGGEVSRAVACVGQVANGAQVAEVYGGEWCLDPALEFRAHLRAILAALSPEAPARGEAVVKGGQWDAHTGEDYAVVMLPSEHTENASIRVYSDDETLPQRIADALNALTPRHEAPAPEGGAS